MIRKAILAASFFCATAAVRADGALSRWFNGLPEGTDPATVARRVTDQFLTTRPENYKPAGYHGNNGYGWNRIVQYSVVSLWMNAIACARLTDDEYRMKRLVRLFDDFMPGGAKHKVCSRPRHVDDAIFGALPLEICMVGGQQACSDKGSKAYLDMGLMYADTQWCEPCEASFRERESAPPDVQREYYAKGLSVQTRLWIDDMYMITALQSQAYRATGDRKYIERAAAEMVFYLDKLQLKDGPARGLFYHAPDVRYVWGRGDGWMAAGMALLLDNLPEDSPHRARIMDGYKLMMETLLKFQRKDGLWSQLIDRPDDPRNWGESSCTAMFTYAYLVGIRHGWLDGVKYGPAARDAYDALCARMDKWGNVAGTCEGTSKRNDLDYYFKRHQVNGDPHAQAPMLWIASTLLADGAGAVKGVKTPATSKLFETRVDPESGVVSFALVYGEPDDNRQSLYFITKSMTEDGRFILFNYTVGNERKPRRSPKILMVADLLEDKVKPVARTESISRANIESGTPFVGDPFVECRENYVVFGSPKLGGFFRCDLAEPSKAVKLCGLPKGLDDGEYKAERYYTHLTLTKDRKRAFLDTSLVNAQGRRRWVQGMLDLATGEFDKWGETPFCCNHGQVNPADDTLAMCAWEACWEKDGQEYRKKTGWYPRIWLMKKGWREMLPAKDRNFASHEIWDDDGKGISWCGRPGDYVYHHDLATGRQERWCGIRAARHNNVSPDKKYVVCDEEVGAWWRGCSWHVAFWNRETGRHVWLYSARPPLMPRDNQSKMHPDPHPHFVMQGKYVVCTANNADGHMDLYVTPVAQMVEMTSDPPRAREYVQGPAPIVFDTPAENDRGAMILGNGEMGALAWVDAAGTLHTVIQRSDTWNEAARHVKAGAIDYETGCAVDAGTFRQELSLERGELEASWKSGGREVAVRYRIQHGTDSIAVCDVKGAPKAEAKVVNWRLYPGGVKEFGCDWKELGNQCERILVDGKPLRFTVSADRLVPGGWCHVNRNATVAEMMKVYDRFQATDDIGREDMLSNRVFGGVTRKVAGTTDVLFLTAVTCSHPCKDEAEWLRRTNGLLDRDGWTPDAEKAKRAEHVAWWRAFWNRSRIAVKPSSGSSPRVRFAFPHNARLPVSIGRDSKGGTEFTGTLKVDPASRIDRDGLFLAATFNAKDTHRNQRLIDNITPGGTDGSLVDILDGRLRLLVAQKAVYHPVKVPAGRDVRVEVGVSLDGKVKMALDGKVHTDDLAAASIAAPATCAAVTRAWAAQRYVTACAGMGAYPIRFNGSIFTTSEKGDPDYRRWGHGYWWQNTRLPYYPMFAAGDREMLKPLFRMHVGLLDFNVKRTRKYLGHGGAYIPECIMPWGDHFPFVYGAKYEWKDRPDKLQDGGWHKYEWVGQLEVSLMLLDYHAYAQDDAWFKAKALPAIREYVRFFDEHYALDARGRYNMDPAQALETWWDCTNPMPEVAGLTCVTERLLALPKGLLADADRELFTKIRARIPDLPTRTLKDGRVAYAPAERFAKKCNVEHPELYCVFPFRLCSFEKPNAALGRAAYAARTDRHYQGWKQEELFAAYLGMVDEAAEHLVNRVLNNSAAGFRWPAYWGPNFDWRPDQCAGGNIQNILQSMLLQYEGDKIFLLPAWPKDWDCDFKLHAPKNTTVEGRVENGELKGLVVTPASRRGDVVVCGK